MVKAVEIKKHYKKTEVGIIPVDWEVTELAELANIKTGPFGSALHEKDYVDDGTPIITVEHLSEQGVVHEKLPMVSDFDKNRLKAYTLKKGDIVFSRVGSVDRNSLIEEKENGWLFSGRLLRVRITTTNISSNYLSYHFHQEATKQRIRSVAVGQTMASLNTQILKTIVVAFPPTKTEQASIATALNDADKLIAALEKLIAKKRAIKQGAMQELLKPKERWEVKTIDELTECLDNLRVPLNETQRNMMRGAYPYCGANGVLDYINDYRIDDEVILIAEDGGYFDQYAARPIAYLMKGKIWVNNHAHVLKAKPDNDQSFIFYSLVHKNILTYLASGTRAKLNKSEMYKIEINIPKEKSEQTRIAQILSDMDTEIEALEKKLEKYKMLKQGMMQNLLTGRIRLI